MSDHNLRGALRATLTLTYSEHVNLFQSTSAHKKELLEVGQRTSFWSRFRLGTCQELAGLVNGFARHFDLVPKPLDFIARALDQCPGL